MHTRTNRYRLFVVSYYICHFGDVQLQAQMLNTAKFNRGEVPVLL